MTVIQGEAFSLIEKKINDLVALVATLKEDKARLAADLEQSRAEAAELAKKLADLANERVEVKSRVEKLLGRLEGIEL
jgi:FtsZ-binding cell division protein ZapB